MTYTAKHPELRYLYFIRGGDTVKVGISVSPERRMKQLESETQQQLEIMTAIPFSGDCEPYCHERLAAYNIKGEWFYYVPEIKNLIREMWHRWVMTLRKLNSLGIKSESEIRQWFELVAESRSTHKKLERNYARTH